ncbi:unnamed protein product [Lactuca saligna]|uniref:Uncharacterized protein n=1 Tax=Lactuca saligna TaxID=75948 RepID=A0AA36EFQ4_LACSI|nr:unnamed protein product [Lactuca saligna]
MKRFMALGDDDSDDLITDVTPPNSLDDNPPPLPRPSNLYPSSSSSLPPPSTILPLLSGSPPQSDAAKKGENNQESHDQKMQMMVIAPTPSQPEILETKRVEANLQKEIFFIGILEYGTKIDDQPILDFGDKSETDHYEGVLDLGFMPPAVVPNVPLNSICPDSCFEGEIPQETNTYIEFDQLNP